MGKSLIVKKDDDLIPQNGEQMAFDYNYMNTERYIYKSNNLIESSYKLSLNAHRLINMSIKKLRPIYIKSKLKPSQLNSLAANIAFSSLRVYATEFKSMYKLKGHSVYDYLKKAADEVFEAEIDYFDVNTRGYTRMRWSPHCTYNEEECYVNLRFSPSLILDLLLFRTNYSRLLFDATSTFKSTYHIRTYELAKRALADGKFTISLEEYRFKLAIEPKKYSDFSKLNDSVIKSSVKAINSKSDIEVYKVEPIRQGRKVCAITFYVRENKEFVELLKDGKLEISEFKEDPESVEIVRQIIGANASAADVTTIINAAVLGITENKIDESFESYLYGRVEAVKVYGQRNDIDDYIAILKTALENNWKANKKAKEKIGFNNFDGRDYENGYAGRTFETLEEQLTDHSNEKWY